MEQTSVARREVEVSEEDRAPNEEKGGSKSRSYVTTIVPTLPSGFLTKILPTKFTQIDPEAAPGASEIGIAKSETAKSFTFEI